MAPGGRDVAHSPGGAAESPVLVLSCEENEQSRESNKAPWVAPLMSFFLTDSESTKPHRPLAATPVPIDTGNDAKPEPYGPRLGTLVGEWPEGIGRSSVAVPSAVPHEEGARDVQG